jgi:integration host factor subunit alpha
MALNKKAIIDQIQNDLGYQRNKATLEIIKSTLESGDDVLISGFGKFSVKDKKERKDRNPATGEDLMLEPRRVVTFKCSGKLRDKLNGKRLGSMVPLSDVIGTVWRIRAVGRGNRNRQPSPPMQKDRA